MIDPVAEAVAALRREAWVASWPVLLPHVRAAILAAHEEACGQCLEVALYKVSSPIMLEKHPEVLIELACKRRAELEGLLV